MFKLEKSRFYVFLMAVITIFIFYVLQEKVGLTDAVFACLYPPVAMILWVAFVVVPHKYKDAENMTVFVWTIIFTGLLGLVYPFLLFCYLVAIPKAWLQYVSRWLLYGYPASTVSINAELANVNNYSIGAVHENFTELLAIFMVSNDAYVLVFVVLAWLLAWAVYGAMKAYGLQNNWAVAFFSGLWIYLLLFALFKVI
ncbi:hypothetical protein HAP94_11040 [Acidithiobacillus ferrivorans]|nr:hypothetical protein [Acidithiobacillus ferrivorans]